MKKAIAIFLVFTLLWGNTGFCLNVHYCETSKAVSLMVNHIIGERCEEATFEKESCEFNTTKSCCTELKEKLAVKKDCCSDTEFELKINDSFQGAAYRVLIQQTAFVQPYISFADFFSPFLHVAEDDSYLFLPPHLQERHLSCITGAELLIQKCVYRI